MCTDPSQRGSSSKDGPPAKESLKLSPSQGRPPRWPCPERSCRRRCREPPRWGDWSPKCTGKSQITTGKRNKDQAWRSGMMEDNTLYLFTTSGNHQWGRVGEWHALGEGGRLWDTLSEATDLSWLLITYFTTGRIKYQLTYNHVFLQS